ncbi:ATP-binding protein [Clostridium septicum]|uniref:PAS domain-containing sensor histidine kinase n=1 Tax=Clostridium septicum TaxID=1504 RepID=UPI00272EA222|nr:ATP-binding protein [Clostridium septicum]WLF68711.1 ATP-binding protein [Clostridium septicum]
MKYKSVKKINVKDKFYKVLMSIVLGLTSFILTFIFINAYIYNLKIGTGLNLILPILVTLNWGSIYGLLSMSIGLAGVYPFIIFDGNIILAIFTFMYDLVFIVLHGLGKNSRKNKRTIINNIYILQILYSIFVILSMIVFTVIYKKSILDVSIRLFIIKEVIGKFAVISIGTTLMKLPFIKKIFKIKSNSVDLKNTKIMALVIAIGTTFFLGVISITQYLIEEDKTFRWIISPTDKEKLVYIMSLTILIIIAGKIIDLYEKAIKAIKEAEINKLEYIKAKYKQKETEELYKLILYKSLNSVVIYEAVYDENKNVVDLQYVYANKSYRDLMGLSDEKIIGKLRRKDLGLVDEGLDKYYEILEKNKEYKYIEVYNKKNDRYFLVNGFKLKENKLALIILDISKIIKTKNELNSILESTDEFIWVVDKEYKLIRYNSSLARYIKKIYGLDIDKNLEDISKLYDSHESNWNKYYERAIKEGRVKIDCVPIIGGLELEVTLNPIYKDNEISKIAIFGKDVTERNKARNDLIKLNSELEEKIFNRTRKLQIAVNELEAFNYTIAHDIKSPLRAIEAYVRFTLEDHIETLDEEVINTLNEISKITQNITDMTNKLLDYSCTSISNIDRKNINIEDVFFEVFKEIKLSCLERKIVFKINDKLPIVDVDETLIRILIYNLLSNAIKFTRYKEKAFIEVGYKDEKEKYIFYVKDNGIGFDMAYSNKLFNLFERVHSIDEFEGNGIGLTTAKKILEKHNGEIWIESKVNEGTVVYFSLLKVN